MGANFLDCAARVVSDRLCPLCMFPVRVHVHLTNASDETVDERNLAPVMAITLLEGSGVVQDFLHPQ